MHNGKKFDWFTFGICPKCNGLMTNAVYCTPRNIEREKYEGQPDFVFKFAMVCVKCEWMLQVDHHLHIMDKHHAEFIIDEEVRKLCAEVETFTVGDYHGTKI